MSLVGEPLWEKRRNVKISRMADLGFGGRVLAGEDSEEDDEEEEELGFQLGSFAPKPTPAPSVVQQPKFSVQAPAISAGEDDESDEDEEEKSEIATGMEKEETGVTRSTSPSADSSVPSISRPSTPEIPIPPRSDGAAMMGHAIVQKLQPSLDSTIRRIAELTENQERLLAVLSTQHKDVCSNDQIERIAIVMGKLPQYIKKVQDMKTSITDISASVDRMKKRCENLRVDAQSHAIKKENKRESLSQWNKLYAAKSYEGATISTTITSSISTPSRQQPL